MCQQLQTWRRSLLLYKDSLQAFLASSWGNTHCPSWHTTRYTMTSHTSCPKPTTLCEHVCALETCIPLTSLPSSNFQTAAVADRAARGLVCRRSGQPLPDQCARAAAHVWIAGLCIILRVPQGWATLHVVTLHKGCTPEAKYREPAGGESVTCRNSCFNPGF